jgi:hypothetical protein
MLQRTFGKSLEVAARIGLILRFTEGPSWVLAGSKRMPDSPHAHHLASCFCIHVAHYYVR